MCQFDGKHDLHIHTMRMGPTRGAADAKPSQAGTNQSTSTRKRTRARRSRVPSVCCCSLRRAQKRDFALHYVFSAQVQAH